jgi:hypothetical protein
MRVSTVLLALFIGVLAYVLVGAPSVKEVWQGAEVTEQEKAAIAELLVVRKKDREAVLKSAQWSVSPMVMNGEKFRVVRFQSKAEGVTRTFDYLYLLDPAGVPRFRAENNAGDRWKGRLANMKAQDWEPL